MALPRPAVGSTPTTLDALYLLLTTNLDAPIFVNKARKIVSLLAQSPMRS
jgi:hypothetical protein